MEFELKIQRNIGVLNSFVIYLKCLDTSEFGETWVRCFTLHLVSWNITPKDLYSKILNFYGMFYLVQFGINANLYLSHLVVN
jgi:hypothetical protein